MVRIDKGENLAKWYIYVSFSVHDNFCSHTGGILTISEKGRDLITSSIRKMLNFQSSTEAELIVVDENIGKVLWKIKIPFESGCNQ